MSILINKNTRVMTQGMTGKVGQFHTCTVKIMPMARIVS